MKTNVDIASVECFHGRVQQDKAGQHARILGVMKAGVFYTGQELSHLTGLSPNVISARLFELREESLLNRPDDVRKVCPHSNVSVNVHVKPEAIGVAAGSVQMGLIEGAAA